MDSPNPIRLNLSRDLNHAVSYKSTESTENIRHIKPIGFCALEHLLAQVIAKLNTYIL